MEGEGLAVVVVDRMQTERGTHIVGGKLHDARSESSWVVLNLSTSIQKPKKRNTHKGKDNERRNTQRFTTSVFFRHDVNTVHQHLFATTDVLKPSHESRRHHTSPSLSSAYYLEHRAICVCVCVCVLSRYLQHSFRGLLVKADAVEA